MKKKVSKLRITEIISSPFRRCIQTSALIAKELKIDTISIDSRIEETGNAVLNEFNTDPAKVTYYSKEELEQEHNIFIKWMDEDHKPIKPNAGILPTNGLNENDQQYDEFEKKVFPELFAKTGGDTLIMAHAVPCNQWSRKKYMIAECGWIAFKMIGDKAQEIAHSTRCSPKK